MIRNLLVALCMLMMSCAEDLPSLSSAEQEATFCGGICPDGQVSEGRFCSANCGGVCPNAVSCVPAPTASITANPETVFAPAGGAGSTRICWTAQNVRQSLWIRVRLNGEPGSLLANETRNGTHCVNVPWIVAGFDYTFSVHTANADNAPILDSVLVRGVIGEPVCNGGQPCPAGQSCHCLDFCRPSNTICP